MEASADVPVAAIDAPATHSDIAMQDAPTDGSMLQPTTATTPEPPPPMPMGSAQLGYEGLLDAIVAILMTFACLSGANILPAQRQAASDAAIHLSQICASYHTSGTWHKGVSRGRANSPHRQFGPLRHHPRGGEARPAPYCTHWAADYAHQFRGTDHWNPFRRHQLGPELHEFQPWTLAPRRTTPQSPVTPTPRNDWPVLGERSPTIVRTLQWDTSGALARGLTTPLDPYFDYGDPAGLLSYRVGICDVWDRNPLDSRWISVTHVRASSEELPDEEPRVHLPRHNLIHWELPDPPQEYPHARQQAIPIPVHKGGHGNQDKLLAIHYGHYDAYIDDNQAFAALVHVECTPDTAFWQILYHDDQTISLRWCMPDLSRHPNFLYERFLTILPPQELLMREGLTTAHKFALAVMPILEVSQAVQDNAGTFTADMLRHIPSAFKFILKQDN